MNRRALAACLLLLAAPSLAAASSGNFDDLFCDETMRIDYLAPGVAGTSGLRHPWCWRPAAPHGKVGARTLIIDSQVFPRWPDEFHPDRIRAP